MGKIEALHKVNNQEFGSKAFSFECLKNATRKELKEDVIAYLGEYRLNEKRHDYTLIFSNESLSGYRLRDLNRYEPMGDKAKRAIERCKNIGDPTRREEAELIGIESLERQLLSAKEGDVVVWASPPGPAEEGYGDYGFVFLGEVGNVAGSEKEIKMSALRVENPKLEDFNNLLSTRNKTAEDFLRNPILIQNQKAFDVYKTIKIVFNFNEDKSERILVKKVIGNMDSLIDQFVDVMMSGSNSDKARAFNVIENKAIELKKRYQEGGKEENIRFIDDYRNPRLADLYNIYGHQAPVVKGGCGSSAQKSNNILTIGSRIMENILNLRNPKSDKDEFECPKCNYRTNKAVGDTCPSCGLTKEEFIKSGGKTC